MKRGVNHVPGLSCKPSTWDVHPSQIGVDDKLAIGLLTLGSPNSFGEKANS